MKNKGFSLVELIVVLALISLSLSLVVPSLSRFSKTIELKSATKKISGILRYCRSEAVNKGWAYQVLFDQDLREVRIQPVEEEREQGKKFQGKVWASNKVYPLPEGIRFKEIKTTSPQFPSDLPAIEFYPNGGSNGGTILLGSQDRKEYRIRIDFLTGVVTIENG
jgi:general secretion pathway protein H